MPVDIGSSVISKRGEQNQALLCKLPDIAATVEVAQVMSMVKSSQTSCVCLIELEVFNLDEVKSGRSQCKSKNIVLVKGEM